jgi:nucleoid DNA-binding protein
MIGFLFVASDLLAAGIGAGIVAALWRKSVIERTAAEVRRNQQLQWDMRKKQVRTAVTKIMQKRGWEIQHHEGVDTTSNGRHRLHTREQRVVRRGSTSDA